MLSSNKIKFIKSLQQKKYRKLNKLFVVEGYKTVSDVLNSPYKVQEIFVTNDFDKDLNFNTISISNKEMQRISGLKTPGNILAIVQMNEFQPENLIFNNGIILCLDNIQDPGNFGTIIRTANWFGIKNIVCSENTVDLYNPKVLQATMGAFADMNIVYTGLPEFLSNYKNDIFGTFLEGENIYKSELPDNACVVMGNEGNGISKDIEAFINKKLFIPSAGNPKAESLNVSIATAIVLSEFFSKQIL